MVQELRGASFEFIRVLRTNSIRKSQDIDTVKKNEKLYETPVRKLV
jgi:hypothetical protein